MIIINEIYSWCVNHDHQLQLSIWMLLLTSKLYDQIQFLVAGLFSFFISEPKSEKSIKPF